MYFLDFSTQSASQDYVLSCFSYFLHKDYLIMKAKNRDIHQIFECLLVQKWVR